MSDPIVDARRCRWCNRRLTGHGADGTEREHCASPSCTWGTDCRTDILHRQSSR